MDVIARGCLLLKRASRDLKLKIRSRLNFKNILNKRNGLKI
jgi:hypothetical protein